MTKSRWALTIHLVSEFARISLQALGLYTITCNRHREVGCGHLSLSLLFRLGCKLPPKGVRLLLGHYGRQKRRKDQAKRPRARLIQWKSGKDFS